MTNCHNNNTIVNNITINALGQESFQKLLENPTPELTKFMTNCIKNGPTGVCQLLIKKHFDDQQPENHNLRKLNKKDDFIEFHDGTDWQLGLYDNVLEDVFKVLEHHFTNFVDRFACQSQVLRKQWLDKFMKQVGEPLEWDFTSHEYDYEFNDNMTSEEKERLKNRVFNLAVEYIYRHSKRGTPTMGGIAIIFSAVLGYSLAHLILGIAFSASALLVIALFTGLGLVGFIDDYLKVIKERSLGLNSKQKIIGQVLVAGLFGYFGTKFPDKDGLTPISMNLSFLRDTSIKLGIVALIIWVIFMVTATSNGVNLTDGLDGLATGASVMSFLAFVLIGVWQFGQSCGEVAVANCYQVRDPMDLAVLAASLAAACTGFLWWNTSPAKIFMGDTGSLALGGALAGLAISMRTELLLIAIGGLFVIITLSVIIQVGFFKLSGGKRIFRMAPLQHHFELKGWGEVTIVVRFWIIAGLSVTTGLGLFYAQWVAQ